MFEIAAGKLATTKAQAQVWTFADQMVLDHPKTSDELKPLAQKDSVQLPVAEEYARKITGFGVAAPLRNN